MNSGNLICIASCEWRQSGTSSAKVGAKYELAPDHVVSATSSERVSVEYEHRRTLVVESTSGARPCRDRYKLGSGWRRIRTSTNCGSAVYQWRPPMSGPVRAR